MKSFNVIWKTPAKEMLKNFPEEMISWQFDFYAKKIVHFFHRQINTFLDLKNLKACLILENDWAIFETLENPWGGNLINQLLNSKHFLSNDNSVHSKRILLKGDMLTNPLLEQQKPL